MFLADYHIHTNYSPDAVNNMSEMSHAAKERGISQLCFTTHVENCTHGDPTTEVFDPFVQWDEMQAEYEAVCAEFGDSLDMRLGIELGSICHRPHIARDIVTNQKLDFIAGSIHNLRDVDNFAVLDYSKVPDMNEVMEKYLNEYIETAKLRLCDVLGHIGYMQKYMKKQGFEIDLMAYEPLLRELFEACVQNGVGIEVNTSGTYDSLKKLVPHLPVLRLYRECGGEIITAGSDSHRTAHAGLGISEAYDAIRAAGFKYITTFKNRKPTFIKL